MNTYKIIVPGTKVDMEIEADRIEKNSAGSVIVSNLVSHGKYADDEVVVGVFPRETIAYKIDSSPWKNKVDKIIEFINEIRSSIESPVDPNKNADIEMRRQIIKDFQIYLNPIIGIINGSDTREEEKEEGEDS